MHIYLLLVRYTISYKQLKSIAVEGASVGFISLDYPLPKGGMLKLPFWVLTYWKELTRVCKGKDQWKCAIEWLKKEHAYNALKILEDASWMECMLAHV